MRQVRMVEPLTHHPCTLRNVVSLYGPSTEMPQKEELLHGNNAVEYKYVYVYIYIYIYIDIR